MSKAQKCIMIIGPHRSGTSALSGAMEQMGIPFGDNLLAASFDNPKGFFENEEIVRLNDEILHHFGSKWYTTSPLDKNWIEDERIYYFQKRAVDIITSEYADLPVFAIKDPRISILFPFWEAVLTDELDINLNVVIVYRNPKETIASLMKRNNFSYQIAENTTLLHLLTAEKNTRKIKRSWVDFNSLLSDPSAVLKYIADDLDLELKGDFEVLDSEKSFIDKKLINADEKSSPTDMKEANDLLDVYGCIKTQEDSMHIDLDTYWYSIYLNDEFVDSSAFNTSSSLPLIKTICGSIVTIMRSPIRFIKIVNIQNLKILLKAVKEENPQTIISNLKKLLNQ